MGFFNDIADKVGESTGLTDTLKGLQSGDLDRALQGLKTLSGGPRATSQEDPLRDKWVATNTSYSGTDVVPVVRMKGSIFTLGNVQTISISTFREKEPVRVLGKSYVKSYTAGPRTIAGTITFTLFNRDPLWDILRYLKEETKTHSDRYHSPLGDQMPPIDIILWFSNEYGRKSLQTLYGVEFTQEGQVHSVNDIYSEKTIQYVARDMDIMVDYDDIGEFRNLLYERQLTGQFTDNYLVSMIDYRKTIEKQIMDCDAVIHRIKLERGRRGMVTFGITALFGDKDLKTEYEKQVYKKMKLIDELEATEQAIVAWSKNIYEKNDYFGGEGSAAIDDLRQNPNTKKAFHDERFNEEISGTDYDRLKPTLGPIPDEYVVVFESPSENTGTAVAGNPTINPNGNASRNYQKGKPGFDSPTSNTGTLTK
jgi:hypothetical protein